MVRVVEKFVSKTQRIMADRVERVAEARKKKLGSLRLQEKYNSCEFDHLWGVNSKIFTYA